MARYLRLWLKLLNGRLCCTYETMTKTVIHSNRGPNIVGARGVCVGLPQFHGQPLVEDDEANLLSCMPIDAKSLL